MNKPPIKSLQGINILLQPFSKKHITVNYLNWMNDKEATRFIFKAQGTTSFEDLNSFADTMIKSEVDYFFAILDKKSHRHIGNVRLGPVNFDLLQSDFGILIGDKEFHGRGVGTEVLKLIKDFSFNYLKLESLCFFVVKSHTAAMRLYAKSNFICLGETDKTFYKDGRSWKLVEWTIDRLNYLSNKNE